MYIDVYKRTQEECHTYLDACKTMQEDCHTYIDVHKPKPYVGCMQVQEAQQGPPETLLYVPAIIADASRPDYLMTVDVDPGSAQFQQASSSAGEVTSFISCHIRGFDTRFSMNSLLLNRSAKRLKRIKLCRLEHVKPL